MMGRRKITPSSPYRCWSTGSEFASTCQLTSRDIAVGGKVLCDEANNQTTWASGRTSVQAWFMELIFSLAAKRLEIMLKPDGFSFTWLFVRRTSDLFLKCWNLPHLVMFPIRIIHAGPSLSKTPTHPMVAHMKASQSLLRQTWSNANDDKRTTFAWVWLNVTKCHKFHNSFIPTPPWPFRLFKASTDGVHTLVSPVPTAESLLRPLWPCLCCIDWWFWVMKYKII